MLTTILVAVGVAVVLAVVTGVVFWKVNNKINLVQRNLNKLENKLSAAGAEWLADIFADAIVGDASSLYHKLAMFVESDDITKFFIDNVGLGITIYTIKEAAEYYPEYFNKIKKVFDTVSLQQKAVSNNVTQ